MHPSFIVATKKTALLVLCILFLYKINAQDIDRKRIPVTYVVLPLKGIPAGIETYAVQIKNRQTGWGNSLGNVYDADKITLNGYYRLPTTDDADLVIETEVLVDEVFEQARAQSIELTHKKDKNSPEIKYTAFFYTIYYYTPKIGYRAYTKKGEKIFDGTIGGEMKNMEYGNTSYDNHFASEYSLSSSWNNAKRNQMASMEKSHYDEFLRSVAGIVMSRCMYKSTSTFAAKYVDEKKGRTVYQDLRDALDFFEQAVATIESDKIVLINKLVQPEYEKRIELMNKAIEIWEKALSEADYENKKARIDSKVARHLYFNLTMAYLWKDDFAKAREYAQGRKKDVGSWDKNFLSGIRDLSDVIDFRAARQEANNWRKLMLTDDKEYVYKDPVQRKKEADQLLAMQEKAKADSIAQLKATAAEKKAATKKSKSTASKNNTKPAAKKKS